MHVCLTSIELFGDSIFGGFGRSTRMIGRELAKRGAQVSIVVPRRSSERPDRYELDGTTVHQFRPERPWEAIRVFRDLGADVYHSQDPSLTTAFAQVAAPRAAHVVTFRDPTDRSDWRLAAEYANEPWLGWTLYRRFIANPAVTAAVRRADGLYCAAEFFAGKAARIYGLRRRPMFLPSPVEMPDETHKAARPTACFMGRWDGSSASSSSSSSPPLPGRRLRRGGWRPGPRARPRLTGAVRRHSQPAAARRARPVRDVRLERRP